LRPTTSAGCGLSGTVEPLCLLPDVMMCTVRLLLDPALNPILCERHTTPPTLKLFLLMTTPRSSPFPSRPFKSDCLVSPPSPDLQRVPSLRRPPPPTRPRLPNDGTCRQAPPWCYSCDPPFTVPLRIPPDIAPPLPPFTCVAQVPRVCTRYLRELFFCSTKPWPFFPPRFHPRTLETATPCSGTRPPLPAPGR